MRKTALQARLNNFFKQTGQDITMSQQAFSKIRAQFNHYPFEKMVRTLVADEYSGNYDVPTWNGYHLMAIDGSTAQLPNDPDLIRHFGTMGGKNKRERACAGMSILYDVLHGWVVNPVFTSSSMNERTELTKHIDFLTNMMPEIGKKTLILLDRGYPSSDVFERLERAGLKYLCRCSSKFLTAVNNAPMGDSVVAIPNGMILRVFKFLLNNGDVETLVTNLFNEDCDAFPELYAKRWGIETAYNILKNRLCVENFSGRTINTVFQDFWASMVLMILIAVMGAEANLDVQALRDGKHNKHRYKPNIGNLVVTLRDEFIVCVFREMESHSDHHLQRIIDTIARSVLPIRPGRSSPRNGFSRQNMRFPANSKSRL